MSRRLGVYGLERPMSPSSLSKPGVRTSRTFETDHPLAMLSMRRAAGSSPYFFQEGTDVKASSLQWAVSEKGFFDESSYDSPRQQVIMLPCVVRVRSI